jgi:hypothetical protein
MKKIFQFKESFQKFFKKEKKKMRNSFPSGIIISKCSAFKLENVLSKSFFFLEFKGVRQVWEKTPYFLTIFYS